MNTFFSEAARSEKRFNYERWKQFFLLTIIQAYLILIELQSSIEVFPLHHNALRINEPVKEIPPIISWVKQKPTIFVINGDKLSYPTLACVTNCICTNFSNENNCSCNLFRFDVHFDNIGDDYSTYS